MIKLIILVSFLSTIFAAPNSGEPANWLTGWLIPDPGLFIWTLITFGIVLFILKWKAWGPLMSALEEREKRISDALSSADKAKEEAEKSLSSYWGALEGTIDPMKVSKAADNSVIGNVEEVAKNIMIIVMLLVK